MCLLLPLRPPSPFLALGVRRGGGGVLWTMPETARPGAPLGFWCWAATVWGVPAPPPSLLQISLGCWVPHCHPRRPLFLGIIPVLQPHLPPPPRTEPSLTTGDGGAQTLLLKTARALQPLPGFRSASLSSPPHTPHCLLEGCPSCACWGPTQSVLSLCILEQ